MDWIGSAEISMVADKVAYYLAPDTEDLQPDWSAELKKLATGLSWFQCAFELFKKQNSKLAVGVDGNMALESLVWELRDAVEEAEDVMDEIDYYQIESQVFANRAADNKVLVALSDTKRRKISESTVKYLPSSSDESDVLLNKLRGAIQKIDAVKKYAEGLIDILNVPVDVASDNLASRNYHSKSNSETGHMLAVDEVFGRDKEQKQIVNWLFQTDSSQKISALTICGMGGLGKTTLCQAIFNDGAVQDLFELKIWICVSNQFDVIKLLTKAIEFARGSAPVTTTLSILQQNLVDIVTRRKFLLVLDDVWNDGDLPSWQKFITPLKHGEIGSKILITTRLSSIGTMIANILLTKDKMQNLTTLSDVDSLSLFNKLVFAGVNPDNYKDLQKIGNNILKKCGGLPLFVKLIAGILRSNLNYSYWERIWKEDILNLDDQMRDGFDVLKLSYQHLPPNLQACFRFCSVYPQGYQFKRSELVHMWVGAGLIQKSRNDKTLIEEVGEKYLDSLQTRSFFELQDLSSDEKFYFMHDLLHDLAREISEGECLAIVGNEFNHIPKTLRHLSIFEPNLNVLNNLSHLQSLRTLQINCKGIPPVLTNVVTETLMQFKSLRTLCLSYLPGIAQLDAIRHLKHLRHLDCSIKSDKNHWFPGATIHKLYHLQSLSLSCDCAQGNCLADGINIEGIGNLIKLRHLILPHSFWGRISLTKHLADLQEVEYYVKNDNDFKISNLKHLNKLRKLRIVGLTNLTSPAEATEVNLYAKAHLQRLSLQWRDNDPKPRQNEPRHDPEFHERVLDLLQPHSHLEEFELLYYEGRKAPTWMSSHYLLSVVSIHLRDSVNLEYLPPLGKLVSLKFIHLSNLPSVKQFGMDFFEGNGVSGFPSLEKFTLWNMENLEEWTRVDKTILFPSLKILEVHKCKKLKELPSLPLCLEILNLYDVGLIVLPQFEGSALQEMKISCCENLTSLHGLHGLSSLIKLSICGCHNLISMDEQYSTSEAAFPFPVQQLEIDDVLLLQVEPLKRIRSAQKLCIHNDRKVECLPENWLLENHTSLMLLDINDAPHLRFLPATLRSLFFLQKITIYNAPLLETLPTMPSVNTLIIKNCPLLEKQFQRDSGYGWPINTQISEPDAFITNAEELVDISTISDDESRYTLIADEVFEQEEEKQKMMQLLLSTDCNENIFVAIRMLMEKVSSYLSQEPKELQPEMISELQELDRCLSQFQYAITEAKKQNIGVGQSNVTLESLRWEIRDAVEEAEDVLHEIEYYQLERQATSTRPTNNVTSDTEREFSDTMLNKLREAIHKLDSVTTNSECLADIFAVSNALTSDYRTSAYQTESRLTVNEVFGRRKEKEEILKWLMQTHCAKSISALTICGMGGLGKTTLSQFIFSDESIINHFQVKIWIHVSKKFDDAKPLLTKAIESVTGSTPDTKTLSVLQRNLLNIVDTKKFLVVLDGVSDDANLTSWKDFIAPLKHGDKGSKILITTRLESVGKMIDEVLMIEEEMFNLTSLGEDDCMSLFKKHAFSGLKHADYSKLLTTSKKIVKKCGGFPLAVKLMGRLLRSNLDDGYWAKVLEYDILHMKTGINNIAKEVLKLCYRHLAPNLQSCFRFCSTFPQDFQFRSKELVHMWIGSGFIIQQSRYDKRALEEIGEEYLNILQARSFFELEDCYGDEQCYVMHDVVHEFARVVSDGECLEVVGNKFEYIPKTLRHLSIRQPTQDVLNHLPNLQQLRTLDVDFCGVSPELTLVINEALSKLTRLRVLHLRDISIAVRLDAIGHFKHLQYLNWVYVHESNVIYWFPEPIYTLYHLQFLSYSCQCCHPLDCATADGIKVDGIGNLHKLRHLDIPNSLFQCMIQIQHLIELQEVTFCVRKESNFRLSNLKSLNNLRSLTIVELGDLTSPSEAEDVDLYAKEHLQELSLLWREEASHDAIRHGPQIHEQILGNLHPYSNIKKLQIWNYRGRRVPSWMTSHNLSSVVHFELRGCKYLDYLPPLRMCSLKVLHFSSMPSVKQFSEEFYRGNDIIGFPSLEELIIEDMENLEWTATDSIDWFPHLMELEVRNCSKLKELPSLPLSLQKLHLDSVGLIALPHWKDLRINSGSPSSTLSSNKHSPALQQLNISCCNDLVFYQPTLSKCVFLTDLFIGDCPKLNASDSSSILYLSDLSTSLYRLQLQNLPSITSLPSTEVFSKYTTLNDIHLSYCNSVISLGGLHALTSLWYLTIIQCHKLPSLSELDGLTSLRTLSISQCNMISSLSGLHGLISLRYLTISQCNKLTSLSGLHGLTSLTSLSISQCNKLTSVSSLHITSLRNLTISQCNSLIVTSEDVLSFPLRELKIDDAVLSQIEPLRCIASAPFSSNQ